MKHFFALLFLGQGIGLAYVQAETINIKKISNSKFTKAERWIDSETGIICYSAATSTSDNFRKQCLVPEHKAVVDSKIEVTSILASQYKQAEKWQDESNKIACYSALVAGMTASSFDLVCSRY